MGIIERSAIFPIADADLATQRIRTIATEMAIGVVDTISPIRAFCDGMVDEFQRKLQHFENNVSTHCWYDNRHSGDRTPITVPTNKIYFDIPRMHEQR